MAFDDAQKARRKDWIQHKLQECIAADPSVGGDVVAVANLMLDCIMDHIDEFNDDTQTEDYITGREATNKSDEIAKLEAELTKLKGK